MLLLSASKTPSFSSLPALTAKIEPQSRVTRMRCFGRPKQPLAHNGSLCAYQRMGMAEQNISEEGKGRTEHIREWGW